VLCFLVTATLIIAEMWGSAPAFAQGAEDDGSPTVAVLPFRVHSAQPIEYLGDSLADLLRSRLEAGGRLRVVDASDAQPALESGETGDAALRRAARGLGADYIVTGSLTELAGRYSLDVRVTPAAVGLESHTQVLTAQRDEELLGRVNRIADRITEQIVGAIPALVAGVEIRGAAGLAAVLFEQLETREGSAYDPLTVRADLAAMRANDSIVSASAETERSEEGVVVLFDLVLADPDDAPAPTGDRVAALEIRGNRRIEADAIRARIASRVGSRFDAVQISKDIAEVHALGFFRNVTARTRVENGERVLIFEVEENPVIRQISISGNDNIDSDKIRDVLTLTTGSTLDYPLLFENRLRIEALYRAQGYYLAEVAFEIDPLAESSVGIHFEVGENEKQKLRTIAFEGNEFFTSGELMEDFQTKRWRFWSLATSWFDRSGTYSEPLFAQDLRGIGKRYSDAGFLQVEIGEPIVEANEEGLTVTVPIVEGRRFSVGELDVVGDSTVDIDALRNKLRLRTGKIFNRSYLTADIEALTEHYQDRGFYFAQVTPLSDLSEASDTVDVTFDVRKGPLYFIRNIEITGNTITVDPVVRREIPIAEGQLYSQRAIQIARSRVQRLGYFEEVDLQMEATDASDQLDMKMSVVERPTGSFSFGAGFSSQDGLVLNGSLAQSNLFGRGYSANINVDIGGRTQRFLVSLRDPYFLGTTFSLGTTVSRNRFRVDSFEQEQIGAEIVLGHALTEDGRTHGFARYSFDLRRLADTSSANAAGLIFRELLQDTLSGSMVGLGIRQDTRDDFLAPTAGRQLQLNLEGAGLGGFSRFIRLEGRGAWYLGAPRWMPDRSSFVFTTRFGWAEPFNVIGDYSTPSVDPDLLPGAGTEGKVARLSDFDNDLELPLTERYFLGGIGRYTLRGFEARTLGPRRAVLRRYDDGRFAPVGINPNTGKCEDDALGNPVFGGNGNGKCNTGREKDNDDFKDLRETDVVGGNKFISTSFEYRFPISEAVGLQGIAFLDMGNAFDENEYNLFDVTAWRYGTGAGVQWFSPFGPLALILGFPLDPLDIDQSPVFEFSVGGSSL
jgi:outer membrane protein insertion porin family